MKITKIIMFMFLFSHTNSCGQDSFNANDGKITNVEEGSGLDPYEKETNESEEKKADESEEKKADESEEENETNYTYAADISDGMYLLYDVEADSFEFGMMYYTIVGDYYLTTSFDISTGTYTVTGSGIASMYYLGVYIGDIGCAGGQSISSFKVDSNSEIIPSSHRLIRDDCNIGSSAGSNLYVESQYIYSTYEGLTRSVLAVVSGYVVTYNYYYKFVN